MNQDKLFAIIGKTLNGEASTIEKQQLQAWQDENEENEKLFQKLKGIWINTRISHVSSTDQSFQKVIRKIQNSGKYYQKPLTNGYRKSARDYLYWAAAIAFIIVSTIIFYNQQQVQLQNTHTIATIIKENPSGQKSKVHLPDGSIVWLNAESKLKYPVSFDNLQRLVQLEGEAFFEVVKDSKRPFSVVSGNITTTALGTSFNISAFSEENEILVTLATGKVKVKSNNHQVEFLEPGFGLSYNKADNNLKVLPINVENNTAWIDGVLLFEEDNFEEIINKLQRWYGVQIEVIGKPGNAMTYTAKFKNEYLSNVLESMRFGRPFTYDINDKVVTIKF